MNSRQESKKLKATLLAIDLLLFAAALVGIVYCGWWVWKIADVSSNGYEATMQQLADRETYIEAELEAARPQIEQIEAQAASDLAQAQSQRDLAQADLYAAIAQRDDVQKQIADIQMKLDEYGTMEQQIADLRVEYGQTIRQLEEMVVAGETDVRICYLTFDDGPSYHTEDFLDELDRLDVKATFFTIGIGVSENNFNLRDACLKRQASSGHAIANHTYTHAFYGPVYKSVDSFTSAVERQDDVVYNATGMHTDIVRFPAGSYYCTYRTSTIAALKEMGYEWIDWLGNAYDSGNTKRSSASIARAVISQARQVDIYVGLMHDWNRNTLGALDEIVTTLRDEGYIFLPLFKESITMGDYTKPRWDD